MVMQDHTGEQVAERGEALYRDIRSKVDTPENLGKYLVVDIGSGDYEMDRDHAAVYTRMHKRHPDGVFYGVRVGFPAAAAIGGWRAAGR